MKRSQILLVDDEEEILKLLEKVLKKEGFSFIDCAKTGYQALALAQKKSYHLIVLDIMLPDLDGFEVCRELRKKTFAPILFLTARNMDLDKLIGLELGGDDYITKPFNPLEVVARIKAQLRRQFFFTPSHHDLSNKTYDFGQFLVNEHEGVLVSNNKTIPLTAKELKLLVFLCSHPNQIFSRRQLYQTVWNEEKYGDENTVTVYIRRIREKIEKDPSNPEYLITIRGLGYKMIRKV